MKSETAKLLCQAAKQLDIDARTLPGYSGRGMMGKTTDAFVFTGDRRNSLLLLVAQAAVNGMDLEEIELLQTDNLSDDIIVY
jgi:orotidine-5'-phosphate decarboxylase